MRAFLIKSIVFFATLSIGLVIVYWIFDPEGSTAGDMRYIKTRNITSKPDKYNTLLIGSSRVYDIENVTDCNFSIYNYGFIQAMPKDFPAFINYARKNQPIKRVIVGLDFYGTSIKGLNDARAIWKDSEKYINDIKDESIVKKLMFIYDFSRFKRLVNYKILGNDPFDRSQTSVQPLNKEWNPVFWSIYESAYSSYAFNDSLSAVYQRIKESSAGIDLVVYITPESKLLFELMVDKNLRSYYEKFLQTAVEEFDTVYNLMEVNEFTSSPANFKDESHLTNENLHSIICQLANYDKPNLSGTLLTSRNIDDYIRNKRYLNGQPIADEKNALRQKK